MYSVAMSKGMDTAQWIAFFRKAGLPATVAANYALIFYDNRIQIDMLLDLSKEYLYDMGIKVMGDVIAILKFAKEFHNQLAKERVIGNSPVSQTPAGRMVGHYTKSSPVRISASPAERGNFSSGVQKKSTIINLRRKVPSEVPPQRIRRVRPEEEGAYNIKMPSGTTARTRKILQKQQAAQGLKRSVFSRLGDSAVSSSTDSKVSSSVFERLGPSNVRDDTPSSTVFSDFDRPKVSGPALPYRGVLKMTISKNRMANSSPRKVNIASRTVLKPGGSPKQNISKRANVNRINTILQGNRTNVPLMRSQKNSTGTHGIFGNQDAMQRLGIKSRLGAKVDARNLTRTKMMLTKNISPLNRPSNVFERLGM